MLPTIVSTKYGRYKVNQDDLATFLAVTGVLCGAPVSLTKQENASPEHVKSNRPKGKDRKIAKQRAADGLFDEATRQRAPKLALRSYIPLADFIAQSTSAHSRIPKWIITVLDKIIHDREDCFQHINGEGVEAFLARGQQDGHTHPINVLKRVRDILVPKYDKQVATAQKMLKHKTPTKRALGEASGNINVDNTANYFAKLSTKSPESSPLHDADSQDQLGDADAEDLEKADAWRTSLSPSQVFAAYPEATREEAWLALGSLREDMISMRKTVLGEWDKWKEGAVDLAAVAVTTNTAIDLARSLEKQARPVIESYTKTIDAKETQLPVCWFTLGTWVKDINGRTHGTNIYAPLLGTDNADRAHFPADFWAHDTGPVVDGQYTGDWLVESSSFRWAYALVQLYCMEFFTKTNASFKLPPNHEPFRSGNGDRPDHSRLFEHPRTCRGKDIQWLYDLSFLGNYGYGPIFPCLDEVSRGFRIMHEEFDIKIWAVFGVQLFCDIKSMLTEDNELQPLVALDRFVRGGYALFRKAEGLYTSILDANSEGNNIGGQSDEPIKRSQAGQTMLSCLFPERLAEEIENLGHTSYPNPNNYYLIRQHPILCGILLHTARLVVQTCGIEIESCTRSIMKVAHFHNACSTSGLIKHDWFDLNHCVRELQGPNLFLLGKPPGKQTGTGYGKAFLLAAGAVSLAYAAPDCRDRMGRRSRHAPEHQPKARKKRPGKFLQKLGPVSLMFEDRFCRTGERYDLNEQDVQAIAERASAYKDTKSKTGPAAAAAAAAKPRSLAKLLSDLSHGLDQEVLPISFPYVSLNVDCTSFIWRIEKEIRLAHHGLIESGNIALGFGTLALHLLVDHPDKLWIVADEIHKYVAEGDPEMRNGFAAYDWVLENIREPLSDAIEESMRDNAQKTAVPRGLEDEAAADTGAP